MLSRPKAGWSTISLSEDASFAISYLVDVPVIWSGQLADAIRNRTPAALYADLEGSEIYIVLDASFGAVIADEALLGVQRLDADLIRFSKAFLEDVRKELDAWIRWEPSTEFMEDLSPREEAVRNALADLESALALAEA